MNLTEEKPADVSTGIKDLRGVPLSLVPEEDLGDILHRIVPASSAVPPVPVAAFNSSI
jgi:FXSXX-COOH protein